MNRNMHSSPNAINKVSSLEAQIASLTASKSALTHDVSTLQHRILALENSQLQTNRENATSLHLSALIEAYVTSSTAENTAMLQSHETLKLQLESSERLVVLLSEKMVNLVSQCSARIQKIEDGSATNVNKKGGGYITDSRGAVDSEKINNIEQTLDAIRGPLTTSLREVRLEVNSLWNEFRRQNEVNQVHSNKSNVKMVEFERKLKDFVGKNGGAVKESAVVAPVAGTTAHKLALLRAFTKKTGAISLASKSAATEEKKEETKDKEDGDATPTKTAFSFVKLGHESLKFGDEKERTEEDGDGDGDEGGNFDFNFA